MYNYYLADNDYASKTRYAKISFLTCFFDYLKRIKYQIFDQPFNKINTEKRVKAYDKLPNVLSLKEAKKLLNVFNNDTSIENIRSNAILHLCLNSGLRRQEIINLNIKDFNFKNNSFVILGKGNKERMGYLNEPTKKAILKYLDLRNNIKTDTNALFITKYNSRITKDVVHETVKKAYRLANIDDKLYSVHTLRHTCATIMYKAGTNIKTLQEFLGHAKIETTEIYSHIYDLDVEKAMLKNPLGKFKIKDAMKYIAS